MKTIKIIDLLNKIANGEVVPKKIKCDGIIYNLEHKNTIQGSYDYATPSSYLLGELFARKYLSDIVNVEVEIIEEEKEIEKLDENNTNVLTNIIENRKKINELIDAVNELKRGN